MQIAVNGACLAQDTPADTGHTATELMRLLARQQPGHHFILFLVSPLRAGTEFPGNVTPVVLPLKGNRTWHRYWWLEWQLPRAMKPFRPDMLLSLDGTLPLRSKLPSTLLISDFDAAAESPRMQRYLKKNRVKFMAKARSIAVLSDTLETALRTYAPDQAARICRLEPGISPVYRPLEWDDREAVKKEFAGGAEYFILPGSIHPKNNIIPVLRAFSALKRRQRSNIKLVLAGSLTTAGAAIATSLETYKFRQDVVWVDNPDEATTARLIGGAYALLYPSRFEGIAMPVYAALRSQVPVIAMEGQAAREAGGEAVLYTDPANLEDLSEKMSLLYKDEQLRTRLLRQAPPETAFRSWEQAAAQLWDCMTGNTNTNTHH